MELFGIADNVRNVLKKSLEQWKLSLTTNGENLGEVDVKRGIFLGDSILPLLFVLSMLSLSLILKNVNASYEWEKVEYKLHQLLFMNDLELFSKSKEQIYTLVRTVHVFSTDIRLVVFGIKNCGILTLKRKKVVKCKRIELTTSKLIKIFCCDLPNRRNDGNDNRQNILHN